MKNYKTVKELNLTHIRRTGLENKEEWDRRLHFTQIHLLVLFDFNNVNVIH